MFAQAEREKMNKEDVIHINMFYSDIKIIKCAVCREMDGSEYHVKINSIV